MKQPGRSMLELSSRSSHSFHPVVLHYPRALPFMVEAESTLHQYTSLCGGDKQSPRRAASSLERVLRRYKYQSYLRPTGSNFTIRSLNDHCMSDGRGRENTRRYHLATGTRGKSLEIWLNLAGNLNNPTDCIGPNSHLYWLRIKKSVLKVCQL